MRDPELSSLLISPDRTLADAFLKTIPDVRCFQILGDMKEYPPPQSVAIRLRQLQPDVVLLDLATNLDVAEALIALIKSERPASQIIGIHHRREGEAVVRSLRTGATEFLNAPFEAQVQLEVVNRIRRLQPSDPAVARERGKLLCFSSAKPGAGASTLAVETALALKRQTGERVLLIDGDLAAGTLGEQWGARGAGSLVDAANQIRSTGFVEWHTLIADFGGAHLLAAPATPAEPIEAGSLNETLENARSLYGWVVLDLPVVFDRLSLSAIPEADTCYLVSTADLSSLHVARRALALLVELGFHRERFQTVINRRPLRDGMTAVEFQKVLGSPVGAMLPAEATALCRAQTAHKPLGRECDLGKAIEAFTMRIHSQAARLRKSIGIVGARPALGEA